MFKGPERARYNNSRVSKAVSQIRLKSEKCAACSVFKGFVAHTRNPAAIYRLCSGSTAAIDAATSV